MYFWSWVLERSLERKKKKGSPELENLLDFAIFSILGTKTHNFKL